MSERGFLYYWAPVFGAIFLLALGLVAALVHENYTTSEEVAQSHPKVTQQQIRWTDTGSSGALVHQIPVGFGYGGNPYVNVFIGSPPRRYTALLDTGAELSTLPSSIIAELIEQKQLRRVRRIQMRTAAGDLVPSELYVLKSLALPGDCTITNLEVVRADFGTPIVGMNVIRPMIPFSLYANQIIHSNRSRLCRSM